MLTIKALVKKKEKRVDGTYNVKVVFTKNRKVKRLSTDIYVSSKDLTDSLQFRKNTDVKKEIDCLVYFYQKLCSQAPLDMDTCDLDDIINYIEGEKRKQNPVDFFSFSDKWIRSCTIKGKKNYQSAINVLKQYVAVDKLLIKDITATFLSGFLDYLNKRHAIKAQSLELLGKRVTSNRATSLYLGCIRHLFNEAKKQFNDYDKNIIVIPNDPFRTFVVPKQEVTRKRALPVSLIKKIYQLPYKGSSRGYKGTSRYDLAKDCFLLSFCMMGMNSVDLFNLAKPQNNSFVYNRTKTKSRRLDKAKMKVDIPKIILPILAKYRDSTGQRAFNFYQYYADRTNFNKAINYGLKQIGEELGIEDLEYYAARHSWATIALNKVGIDKYTVHAALNHLDESMKVTDIYIERDFVNENKANAKVIKYVFGK